MSNSASIVGSEPPQLSRLRIGARFGRYRILGLLGRGGFGEVYRASDLRLQRTVALKVMTGDSADNRALIAEARLAAALEHPRIARLYDYGEARGCAYATMELVEGETLEARIERGRLPWRRAVEIGREVADALAHAHRCGVAHGDLSPANVIVDENGSVKLVDFGLAGWTRAGGGSGMTEGGTPGWLAPERLAGGPASVAADLFGLGATLYWAITGSTTGLGGATPPSLFQAGFEVPLRLEGLVRCLLLSDPARRGANAEAVAGALGALLDSRDPAGSSSIDEPALVGAFRGLAPFQEGDEEAFFGRESDTAAVVALAARADLGLAVLYGASGTGKTSLLQAGVIRGLRRRGLLPVYCRGLGDPVRVLRQEAERQSGIAIAAGETLAGYLERVAIAAETRLVVLYDQFEELFGAARFAEREAFLSEVATLNRASGCRVSVLLAVRSDHLFRIAEAFDGLVSEPLAGCRRHHLRDFTIAQTREVLERSARRALLPIEPQLIDRVAADLADGGRVLPSELQLIGEQIERRRLFDIEAYRKRGGRERLLDDSLEEVIARCPNPAAARSLLCALVSDDDARLQLSAAELAHRIGGDPGLVAQLLAVFIGARLVRELPGDGVGRFELIHDYLVRAVQRTSGPWLDSSRRANRIVRRLLTERAIDPRARLPLRDCLTVLRHADLRDRSIRSLAIKSTRSALVRAVVAIVVVMGLGLGMAAVFSIREQWQPAELRVGHTAAVRRIDISSDGALLASVGEDGRVLVWDLEKRRLLRQLTPHAGWSVGLAFSPDGRFLVSGGSDFRMQAWRVGSFEKVADIQMPCRETNSIAFSSDSRWVAVAGLGSAAGECLGLYEAPDLLERRRVADELSFGDLVFLGGTTVARGDGRIDLGVENPEFSALGPHGRSGAYLALSPRGDELASIDPYGVMRFLALEDPPRIDLEAPLHRFHGRAVGYSPDGALLASAAEDVVLWDRARSAILQRFVTEAPAWDVAFSRDGRLLISAHENGELLAWDVTARRIDSSFSGYHGAVHTLAVSPDGRWLAAAGEDRGIGIWEVSSGHRGRWLDGHTTRVNGLAFLGNQRLLSCDQAGRALLWELGSESFRELGSTTKGESCFDAAASLGAGRLAAGSSVWDSTGQRLPQPGGGTTGLVYVWAFSPDGRLLLQATDGGELVIRRSLDLQEVGRSRREGTGYLAVDFAPDGRHFATGDRLGEVLLWRTEPLSVAAVIRRMPSRVQVVRFLHDSRRLVVAGDDQKIQLLDVRRSERGPMLIGVHQAPVRSLVISPDGAWMAAGDGQGAVRIYTVARTLWGWQLPGRGRSGRIPEIEAGASR